MMRLLFLCLLLLPAASGSSDEIGSGDGPDDDDDDEEDIVSATEIPRQRAVTHKGVLYPSVDKSVDKAPGQMTVIIVAVAVVAVALSLAVIGAIIFVRHRKQNLQQGVYSVPTEQHQKGAI